MDASFDEDIYTSDDDEPEDDGDESEDAVNDTKMERGLTGESEDAVINDAEMHEMLGRGSYLDDEAALARVLRAPCRREYEIGSLFKTFFGMPV